VRACDGNRSRDVSGAQPRSRLADAPHLVRVCVAEEQVGRLDVRVDVLVLVDVLQNVQLESR